MNSKGSISVIITAHNNENTIRRCVESVLNQLDYDDELIIIDDYSRDRTKYILQEYNKNDKVTIISNKKNRGVSYSRNSGINKSNKPFVTFVDADDILISSWRKDIKNSLSENADLIVYGLESFDTETSITKQVYPQINNKTIIEVIYELDKKGLFASSCNKIYHRETIIKNKVYFNIDAKTLEDYEFNLNYVRFCNRIRCIPKCLYRYIYNQNSASSSFDKEIYNRYICIKKIRREVYINCYGFNKENLYYLESQSLAECINNLYKGDIKKNKKERIKIIKRIYSDGEIDVFKQNFTKKPLVIKIMRISSIVNSPVVFDHIQTILRKIKKAHLVNYYFRKNNKTR